MDAQMIVRAKAALEALNRVGSMTGDALLNYVGVAVCQPITTLDGQLLLKHLITERWAETYTHPTFRTIYYRITIEGQTALVAM